MDLLLVCSGCFFDAGGVALPPMARMGGMPMALHGHGELTLHSQPHSWPLKAVAMAPASTGTTRHPFLLPSGRALLPGRRGGLAIRSFALPLSAESAVRLRPSRVGLAQGFPARDGRRRTQTTTDSSKPGRPLWLARFPVRKRLRRAGASPCTPTTYRWNGIPHSIGPEHAQTTHPKTHRRRIPPPPLKPPKT